MKKLFCNTESYAHQADKHEDIKVIYLHKLPKKKIIHYRKINK